MNNVEITCRRTLTYNCFKCRIPFKRRDELVNHIKQEHLTYKSTCCSYISQKFESLSQHSRDKHEKNENLFHCPFCHYMGDSMNVIASHLFDTHISLKIGYYCVKCGFRTTYEGDMQNHLSVQHKCKLTFCFCSVEPSSASATQLSKTLYNCSYCNYKKDKLRSLQQHFMDAHWFVNLNSDDESDDDYENNEDIDCCFLCEQLISYLNSDEMDTHLISHGTSYNCLFCQYNLL